MKIAESKEKLMDSGYHNAYKIVKNVGCISISCYSRQQGREPLHKQIKSSFVARTVVYDKSYFEKGMTIVNC